MAKVIRRHWKLALLQLLLLLAAAGLLIHRTLKSSGPALAATVDSSTPTSPTTAPAIDVTTFLRVRTLRERLALRNEDLAAMGCSQQQATQVLQALLAWASDNAAGWAQQEQNRRSADAAMAEATRQINVGPRDDALLANLPTLQQNVASAKQQSDAFFQEGADTVAAVLSSDQRQVWATARANSANAVPMRYRYVPGITTDQAKAIRLAINRGQTGEAELPPGAVQSIAGISQTQSSSMRAVLASVRATLPRPPATQAQAQH
jgi:hypothetical protein